MKSVTAFFGKSSTWYLALLWIVATAFNITKAVHIDDPVHLYAANTILTNPFAPYSSWILWGGNYYGQIKDITQPPFLFYVLALGFTVFGESELVSHAILSFFSLLCIWTFYHLAVLHGSTHPRKLTALLVLGPAFIPSQNIMTDIPLLAFVLLFFYFLFSAMQGHRELRSFISAGTFATFACLTKYSGLILLPILALSVFIKSGLRSLWVIAIPCLALGLWSLANYLEFAEFHLYQPALRLIGARWYENTLDWLVCLGAIAPFSILFLGSGLKLQVAILAVAALLTTFLPMYLRQPLSGQARYDIVVRCCYFNGLYITGAVLTRLYLDGTSESIGRSKRLRSLLLGAWIVASFAFIALLAQQMAVRYVLIALPAMLLCIPDILFERGRKVLPVLALGSTALIGMWLGVSDWLFADAQRLVVEKIAIEPARGRTWSAGVWGWQWYSKKAGMQPYHWRAELESGDRVIIPQHIPSQQIMPEHQKLLFKEKEVFIPGSPLTWLRTMYYQPIGGFYVNYGNVTPYRISKGPLAHFEVFTVSQGSDEPLTLPFEVAFSQDSSEIALSGFESEEWWGRWSIARKATVRFRNRLPERFTLVITAFTLPQSVNQKFSVQVGELQFPLSLTAEPTEYRLEIEGAGLQSGAASIREIQFLSPVLQAPGALGDSGDSRLLGVAINKLRIEASTLPQE